MSAEHDDPRALDELDALRAERDALWALLDNVDTLDDACREDDLAFRRLARNHLKARFAVHNPDAAPTRASAPLPPDGLAAAMAVEYAQLTALLECDYTPPKLFIYEEVEIGGGNHALHIANCTAECDWSKPYGKTGPAKYRNRIVRVPYPPPKRESAHDEWTEIGRRCSAGRRSVWMRIAFKPNVPSLPIENSAEAIEIKAGREGGDFEMRIDRTNPQFAELLDLFLTAHFAATT